MNNPVEIFKKFMTMGKDPKQIEEMIYQQNPQLRVLSNQMRQSGLSPVEYVMQYAKQNNIPIQENSVHSMCQQMQSMTPKQ
jgi:hypothetical protein